MESTTKEAGSDFRDTLYTVDKSGKRRWVYSSVVQGKFFKYRRAIAVVLIAYFLAMPWVKINGKQGIWLDILHRKFTFFGTTFWATDTLFLVLVLGSLAISLFFFTSLFGRVWCGWACPETLFLEFVFRPIERLIEGNASQRAKLDAAPWTREKVLKKGTNFLLFSVIAWVLASTFLAYFIGSEPLLRMMSDWPQNNLSPFLLTLAMMGAMLFQFGWFREQFCTVLCPYARFQSVLMDANSLVVGYDASRGEPRGKLSKGEADSEKGDCIDCKLCVRVCPTGIDIRNGLQLECVSCTQCADACDSIMDKIGKPRGLVRYDTENSLLGKESRILRPRVLVYATILMIYGVAFSYLLLNRETSDFQLLRSTTEGVAYTMPSPGEVSNQFDVRLSNKGEKPSEYYFSVSGIDDPTLIVPKNPFPLEAQTVRTVPMFIRFSKLALQEGERKIQVHVRGTDGYEGVQEVTLLGPTE